ncbi:MAG: hypothetical protein Q9227_007733 [Pyrenula ochraceoflavens]
MSKPAKKLNELEQLPLELLEHIFLHALNVNLAKASPILGKAFSSKRILRQLIVEAFCCADASGLEPEQLKTLQCDVLCTSWCTPERLQSCIPRLTELALPHAWRMACTINSRMDELFTENDAYPKMENLLASRTEMEDFFEISGSLFLYFETDNPYSDDQKIKSWEYPVLMVRTLPENLIRACARSQSALELLRFIRPGWRRIPPCNRLEIKPTVRNIPSLEHTATLELLKESIHEAVKLNNLPALFWIAELYTAYYLVVPVGTGDSAELSQKPIDIPETTFELAAQKEKAGEMLTVLVRLAWESIPADNSALTRWAVHTRDRQQKYAAFAKSILEGMAQNRDLLVLLGDGIENVAEALGLEGGYALSKSPASDPLHWFWSGLALESLDIVSRYEDD